VNKTFVTEFCTSSIMTAAIFSLSFQHIHGIYRYSSICLIIQKLMGMSCYSSVLLGTVTRIKKNKASLRPSKPKSISGWRERQHTGMIVIKSFLLSYSYHPHIISFPHFKWKLGLRGLSLVMFCLELIPKLCWGVHNTLLVQWRSWGRPDQCSLLHLKEQGSTLDLSPQ
jgi:hypothetical protein